MKKRLLSIALMLCMVLTLLPTAALAAQILTANNFDELRSAIASASDGDTIAIGSDFYTTSSVVISKNVTLDLEGHTLTYAPPSGSICFRFTTGGVITDSVGGGTLVGAVDSSLLVHNVGGTLEIAGGSLRTTGSQGRTVQNDGTLNITGGEISSTSGYAVLNNGTVDISGGLVETETGVGVLNLSSDSELTMSGGTVETTSSTEQSTFGAYNNASGATITVNGGTASAGSGCALGNLNGGTILVSNGTITSNSGNTILNVGDSTTAIHGGTVSSVSGCALMNYGNLLVDSGSISSEKSLALNNLAKGGTDVRLSGGSLTSNGYTAINNQGSGEIQLLGSEVTSPNAGNSPAVVNFSTGTITVQGGTITTGAAIPVFYNVSSGTIAISGGTYYGVYNTDAGGKVTIDGGSIAMIKGTTPKSSEGVELQEYTIQLTNEGKSIVDTPVSGSELTFTPADKAAYYSFTDVKTDALGGVYLWLPAGITAARYVTGDVDIAGSVSGNSVSTLPNTNFTVSVYLDGELWTDCPAAYHPILMPKDGMIGKFPSFNGGVCSYSGVDANTTYAVLGKAIIGQDAFKNVELSKENPSVRVDYYTLTTTKGSGVSFLYPGGDTKVMKGATVTLSCQPDDGLTFEKWTDDKDGGKTVSTSREFNISIDGLKAYTATAKIEPMDASVTVKKDNKAWTDFGKAIVLSPSNTDVDATSAKSGTADGAEYSVTGLDPTKTYYVWADGIFTGQTVTNSSSGAVVDYYTVMLDKNNGIKEVTGAGTYLKGSSANITAAAADGDYVFSRWNQTDGGALYSSNAATTVSNITAPVKLTAVGASTKYTATVTVKKDGEAWTSGTRGIQLSTSQTAMGDITATPADGVYTISGLDGAKTYYIWDMETESYTGISVSAGDSTANVTMDYYSVNVTNNGGSNLTVTGGGVYLKGSIVTITATPVQYYRVKWDDSTTDFSKTLSNLSKKTDLIVTAEVDVYTGAVTVKKDTDTWTDFTGAITLSTDKTDSAAGKVTGTNNQGVVSFAGLEPQKTYYVWADNTYTGNTIIGKTAAVQYYTVSVAEIGVSDLADKIVLAGQNAAFTAVPNSGFDFMGWYDTSEKVLSTTPAFTLTDVTTKTVLTARASDNFDAVITVNGAIDRKITLKSGSDDAINPTEGTTFKALDRTKTYKVLDNGADTGFTVSKTAPDVTLQYYTVTLDTGADTGIDRVIGAGTYLAGSSVDIQADIKAGSVFGSWTENGGTVLSTQKSYTISAISRDYDLTVKTALSFSGTVDITSGSIVIEDDVKDETHEGHDGKIRITVNGVVPTNGDNLEPGTNITVIGSTKSNCITVTTQYDAMVTLENVNITCSSASPLTMAGTGTLTVDLVGENALQGTGNNHAGLCKMSKYGVGSNIDPMGTLVIQSSSASGNLTAIGGQYAAGIGSDGCLSYSIIINSGIINASGGQYAAGIGGGYSIYSSASSHSSVTINGGTVTGTAIDDGAGIGCGKGSNSTIVINGGTVTGISTNGAGIGACGTASYGYGNATLTINGGTVSGTSTNGAGVGTGQNSDANITINGGSISGSGAKGAVTPAKNDKGELVYKTTFTTGASKITDVSKTLTIRDKNGTAYGMKDVKTDGDGKVYAYLAEDTAGAVYGGDDYGANVTTDGNGTFKKITTETAYTVGVPASATTTGVTATAALQQIIPQYAEGVTVTVNVALSGTALKRGTYTVGLTGASAGTITAPGTVEQHITEGAAPANATYTFTFKMPAQAVSGLAVTLTFTEDTKYTVTYSAPDASGGIVPTGGSYYKDQTYTIAENPGNLTRTGYSFGGWDKNGQQTMGTANVTLAAQWTKNSYTVTFDGNDGTGSMSSQTFHYGMAQPLTANSFTKDGYSFAGWAASAAGAKIYNNRDSITVAQNTSLFALWTKDGYTVTFDGNGATSGSAMDVQTVPNNAPAALSANTFTRTGYTFAGWNMEKGGTGTAYLNGANITASKDVTLYAQWNANPYKVVFSGSGSISGSMGSLACEYHTNVTFTANSFIRTGYTFTGWNTKADGTGSAYTDGQTVQNLTADYNDTVTVYAQWTANPYKVAFDSNNGSGTMLDQPFTYDAASVPLSANTFLRNGYIFAGWNTQKNGEGTAYEDNTPVKNLIADKDGTVTLFAQWAAASFTVKFDKGVGTGSMPDQTFQTGTTAVLKTNAFVKTGYTFTGWKDGNGKDYQDAAKVSTLDFGTNTSITLYAQWNANSYTVKFNANGGTGSMIPQTLPYDAEEAALTANVFTRAGYTFLGWAESPVSTYGEYADGQEISNLTPMDGGVITLYAVWKANIVQVAFNGNEADTGFMPDQSFTYNNEQPLSQNTYQRAGYTFAGWNTQSNGRGVSYADQQEITNPIPDITGSFTLYAQWQQQSRYGLAGLVSTDSDPATPISDATVSLRQGNTVLGATKTDANGNYSFTNLLPGSYNVVCAYDGKTVTKATAVTDKPITVSFKFSNTAKNSLLVLEKDSGVSIPALVVDGLSAVADDQAQEGKVTTVKMTVTAKAPDKNNTEQSDIQKLTKEQTVEMYLDAQLSCNGVSIGASNNTVMEMLIPYDFSAKTDLKVLRWHSGTASVLTELDSRPTSDFADGTWFKDVTGGQIIVYASKFSTYAVSYTAVSYTSSTGSSSRYPIVLDENGVEHGKLMADKSTAVKGEEVTITAKPDSGYCLHHLIVTDVNGKAILYTDKRNGTYTFIMPDSKTAVAAKFAKRSENPFGDVSEAAYYYDALLWAADKGITGGTSAATFSPDGICTRAQTVTFLWRAMGSPDPTSKTCLFNDVKTDAYYYKAVLWATGKGITVGTTTTTFSPGITVTRAQTVTFLWRTAGKSAVTTTNPFGDVKASNYYANAVLWAVKEGITSGTSATAFSPAAGCTRAQIVTFLYRYLNK